MEITEYQKNYMNKETANQIATKVVANALDFFKQNKNFGAQTALKRKDGLKAKLIWLVDYCKRKNIDAYSFMR